MFEKTSVMAEIISPLLKLIAIVGLWPSWKCAKFNFKWLVITITRVAVYLLVVFSGCLLSFTTIEHVRKSSFKTTVVISWSTDVFIAVSDVLLVLLTIWHRYKFEIFIEELSKLNVSRNIKLIKKCNRICYAFIAWVLFVTGMYVITSVGQSVFYVGTSLTLTAVSCAAGYGINLYPIVIKGVFAIIGFIIGKEFEEISSSLELILQDPDSGNQIDLSERLENFRKEHQNLCDLVSQMRDIFSPLFTVTVPCDVAAIVFTSTFVLLLISTRVIDSVLHLFLILVAADYLNNKAAGIERIIQKGSTKRLTITEQLQVSLFAQKNFASCASVDACGFFVISRNLLPAILGSALTYLIILFQTYFST